MRHRRSILCAIAFAAALLAALPAHAFEWHRGNGTNALAFDAHHAFTNEAFVLAHSLDVASHASRDLWLFASTAIHFSGDAGGDVRALARSASFSGTLQRNLIAYANGLHLATNSLARGQVALFGANVICEGTVEGDAWIIARSVTIGGTWNGNLRVTADEIRIAAGTRVAGTLTYSSPKEPVIPASASIAALQQIGELSIADAQSLVSLPLSTRFLINGYLFLAALLAGMPFVGMFPAQAGRAVRGLVLAPWRALVAGFLTVLGGPILIGFALASVVGLPLALLLGALYLTLLYLSHIVVALWIGHAILRNKGPQTFGHVLMAMAVGLFLIYFLTALPGVASFAALPIVVLGAGALVASRQPAGRLRFATHLPPPPAGTPPSADSTPNPPTQP